MYYTITGVVEGDHYTRIIQADSLRAATELFDYQICNDIAEAHDLEPDDTCNAWIISVVRTQEQPERIHVS